jgi:hypothetical protein
MSLRADAVPFVPSGVPPPADDEEGVQPYFPDGTVGGEEGGMDYQHGMPYWDPAWGDPQSHGYDMYGAPMALPPHNNMQGGAPQSQPFYPQRHNGDKKKPKKKKPSVPQQSMASRIQALHATDLPHSGTMEPKALLTEDSAFMAPLRKVTGASLPHIKFDQRYGRKGAPSSALPQFIIAPIVVNYRPVHYHDLTPGDLLEYHYDLALVLQHIETAHTITFSFGKEWKQYCAPYGFVLCSNYESEVKKLLPSAEPNSRVEFVYDDDALKDVTEVLFDLEELAFLRQISLFQAMAMRMDLMPLYEACFAYFADTLPNYEVQFRNIFEIPSKVVVKTGGDIVGRLPRDFKVAEQSVLWNMLPNVSITFSSGQAVAQMQEERTANNYKKPSTSATKPPVTPPLVAAATPAHASRDTPPPDSSLLLPSSRKGPQHNKSSAAISSIQKVCIGLAVSFLTLSVLLRVTGKQK